MVTQMLVRIPLLLALLLTGLVATAQEDDADRPEIRLVQNNWLSSELNAQMARIIIEEELGYPVSLVASSNDDFWADLANAQAHANLEVWPSGHLENIDLFINQLGVVDYGGPLGVIGKISWYVPTYVVEEHPELATWEGYTDPTLTQIFATEDGAAGRFIAGEETWTQYDAQIIENLALALEVERLGSEAAILNALEAAYAEQEPLLFYFWTPHAIHAAYDLTPVALPEYTDQCHAQTERGVKSGVFCDYPSEELFKAFSPTLRDIAPDVHALLSNLQLTTDDQIAMMAAVELDGLSPEDAARAWLEANPQTWRAWLPTD